MRCAAAVLPILVGSCASAPTTSDTSPEPCSVTDCFYQRDVRDFDVIDRNTVVVYVGAQRCPFVVELQNVACEVDFTPAIAFFQTALGRTDRLTPVQSGRVCADTRGLVLYSGIAAPSLLQQQEAIESGFGLPRPDGFPRGAGGADGSFPVDPLSNDVCRVTDIRSINDDQLVELLAEVNAPPPPVGEGRLEVPDEEAAETGGDETDRAETDEPADSPEGERSPPADRDE